MLTKEIYKLLSISIIFGYSKYSEWEQWKANFFIKRKSPDFSSPVFGTGGFFYLNVLHVLLRLFLPTLNVSEALWEPNLECEMMDQPGKQALHLLLLLQAINHIWSWSETCCRGHCSVISSLLYGAGHAGKFSYAVVTHVCMTSG